MRRSAHPWRPQAPTPVAAKDEENDVEEWKQRSREVWSLGDYAPTSRQLEPASAALVEAVGIGAGHRVLDVAAGHGNCAVAAARRGASVVASDFAPTMIAAGSARTAAEGLDIEWREADAADLPFDDASFDRVTSVFGAIFAPEHDAVAAELVRVVRPGGLVGLTAWPPDGMTARIREVAASFGPPPPPGAPDPFRWGDADEVTARFAALGCTVRTRRTAVPFRYASWDAWQRASEAHGLAVVARRSMPPEEYEAMVAALREATAAFDHGDGGEVAYDAEYLEIIVTAPGGPGG